MDSTVIWQCLLLLVLISLNAFFAASEIAFTSLNDVKLRRLAEEGDSKAKRLLAMTEATPRVLSALQVGITLAGFLSVAVAADGFSEPIVKWLTESCGITRLPHALLQTAVVVLITLILAFITLLLGVLVPKRVAMRDPERTAGRVLGPISFLSALLSPTVWMLSACTNGVLRLLGIDPNETLEDVSEEDILDLVDAVEEQGEIDNDTKEMIENVFEFDNTAVGDIMVRRADMTVLYESDPIEEVLVTIRESGLSRFPVCGENTDDIKGIVLAKEILFAYQNDHACRITDLMQKAKFVPDTLPANVLFQDMRGSKMHMVIVVDEYGQTAGLVTMEDLLEEIVGNIYDETDAPETPDIVEQEENRWHIAGSTPVEDAEEVLGVSLRGEEDTYDTVGGFVIAHLSCIPDDGEQPEFTYENLSVRALFVRDKRIELTEFIKTEPTEEDGDAIAMEIEFPSES